MCVKFGKFTVYLYICNMEKLMLDQLNRLSAEDFQKNPKLPVVALLDNVRSLSNVGAFFRNADAFGIKKLVLCGVTGVPPNPEIQKTALGATQTVDWAYFATSLEAVQHFVAQNYVILAVEQTDESVYLQDFVFDDALNYVLIFGNEVAGVDDALLPFCSHAIEIPQVGTKHSLNVGVSAGIVFWSVFEQFLKINKI